MSRPSNTAPGFLRREIALKAEKGRPHLGHDSHNGRHGAHFLAAQFGVLPGIAIQVLRNERRIVAGFQNRQANPAVERSRIEEMIAEMPRQGPGNGALAGGGRAINGDDHFGSRAAMRAPMPFIRPTKPGKLVAMKLPSSMLT